jgi:hypothetical protein
MTATLIDLRQIQSDTSADLAGLHSHLTPLVGEPFRFCRVSYGDELTLHFGDLRPARSPKLKDHMYGAYVLGVRGSTWILKSGSEPLVLTAGAIDLEPAIFGAPLDKKDLEAKPLIEADSRVLAATPFMAKPVNGFGLQLRTSDGSALLIIPSIPVTDDDKDADLPELADWELLSAHGLLSAGPGTKWSFEPTAANVI